MGKTETAASSLVMAVPAGILCYLTIMAGLGSTENMPTLLMAVVWTTAILSFVLALFPLGVLAFMKSTAAAAVPATGAVAAPEASEPKSVGAVEDDDLAETTDLGDVEAESEVAEEDAFGEVEDLGDLDDDLQIDDDAFEMDDIEEEEEPPKKKKKK